MVGWVCERRASEDIVHNEDQFLFQSLAADTAAWFFEEVLEDTETPEYKIQKSKT